MINDYIAGFCLGVAGGFTLGFIFSLLGYGIYKTLKLMERG